MKYLTCLGLLLLLLVSSGEAKPFEEAAQRIVKLYGQGGFRSLEAYQTGLLVTLGGHESSTGWVLTAESPAVVNGGEVLLVLPSGDRYSAQLVTTVPQHELALLQIDLNGEHLPAFDLVAEADLALPERGAPLLALSNLFNIAHGDEPLSLQRGVHRGTGHVTLSRLLGPIERERLLFDRVISNPGAAGGAVLDSQGHLVGMIGTERRSLATGTWISHIVPTQGLLSALQNGSRGTGNKSTPEPPTPEGNLPSLRRGQLLDSLGLVLVPAVAPKTPPWVEHVRADSIADLAGVRANDLLISVEGAPVGSVDRARGLLATISARQQPAVLLLLREDAIIRCTIDPPSQQ